MAHDVRSPGPRFCRLVLVSAILSTPGASAPAPAVARVASPVTIDFVLPTVANNSGVNGTAWRTRIWVFNGDPATATIRGYFGQSLPDPGQRPAAQLHVSPGRTVAFDDVEVGISGPGMMSFDVDEATVTDVRRIVIRSETFNDAGLDEDGVPRRFGLGIDAQKVAQPYSPGATTLSADEDAFLPLPIAPGPASVASASRANLVLVSTTDAGTFDVVLMSPAGEVLTDETGAECRRAVSLPPFTWHQVNDLFSWMRAAPAPNAYLAVRPTMQGAFAAAIHVDNTTGDGALFAATPERAFGTDFVFPVAHADGANGTVWRTDVSILSPRPAPADRSLEIHYTPRSGLYSIAWAMHFVPAPGSVAFRDATVTMFPGNEVMTQGSPTAGSVHGRFVNGPGLITTLTYNDAAAGKFGVAIPAWSPDAAFGGVERIPAVLAGIEESAATRTNLTVRSMSRVPLTITLTGIDENGGWLGTGFFELAGGEERQFPSVLLDTFGLSPPATNATIVLDHVPPPGSGPDSGRFIAYATSINNGTGDSAYLPARPLPEGAVAGAAAADVAFVDDEMRTVRPR